MKMIEVVALTIQATKNLRTLLYSTIETEAS